MARTQLASLGAGVAQRSTGAVSPYHAGTIYLHGTTDPVPVYPTEVGGVADESGVIMTDGLGKIPGWVEVGTVMDITVPPATTITAFASGPGETTALELGDKITWGGFIELWGDVTAAGYQIAQEDTFAVDSSGDYTFDSGHSWSAINERFEFTNTTSGGYRTDWGPFDDTARATVDFTDVDGGRVGVAFKKTVNDHMLGIDLEAAGGGLYNVIFRFGDSGSVSTVDSIALALDTPCVLSVTRQGDNLDWEVVRLSDDVVIASDTEVIPGGALADLGAGVALGDVHFTAWASGSGNTYIDNLRIYTVQQESRDLWVRIIPSGGGDPITKRIFGVQGPTTERTDF